MWQELTLFKNELISVPDDLIFSLKICFIYHEVLFHVSNIATFKFFIAQTINLAI